MSELGNNPHNNPLNIETISLAEPLPCRQIMHEMPPRHQASQIFWQTKVSALSPFVVYQHSQKYRIKLS